MSDLKFIVMCNTIIVAIFSYAIFALGYSGWWFILMFMLFDVRVEKTSPRPRNEPKENGDV